MSRADLGAVMAAAALLAGCVRNPAPRGWLPPATQALHDVYGAWIDVPSRDGAATVSGEFLAVDRDSVFVLTPRGEVTPVALSRAGRVTIAYFDPRTSALVWRTALTSAATLANGFFLVFTLPATVITGTTAAARASRAPLRYVPPDGSWDDVRQFARFPVGLPAGLPRTLPVRPDRP
jgi:hypothetical protein